MANDVELKIIKKFISKEKQERLAFEFQNPKKQETIMLRLFSGPQLFRKHCLREAPFMSAEALRQRLFHISGASYVYYIGESYIGSISLAQAVEKALAGERCIIYCENAVGYYQGEEESGHVPRYFLCEDSGQFKSYDSLN